MVSELPSAGLPDPEPTFALRTSKAAPRLPVKPSVAASSTAQPSGSQGTAKRGAVLKVAASPALSASQTAALAPGTQHAQQMRHSVAYEGQPVQRVVLEVKFGSAACRKLEDALIEICGERVFITVPSGAPYQVRPWHKRSWNIKHLSISLFCTVIGAERNGELYARLVWVVRVQIDLPFAVTSEGARAALDIEHQTLRVELPFRPFKDVLAEVRGNAL